MKIAQIAPIWERIPPKKYGGTERIISDLTEELVKRGHEVTLYASGDSQTSAKLVSVVPAHLRESEKKDLYNGLIPPNILNFALAYQDQDKFDIIHDHNGPSSLPAANLSQTPVIYTLHYIYDKETLLWRNLTNPYLVSISKGSLLPEWKMKTFATVYHGLKMKHYPFSNEHDGYLLFVGRIHPDKGLHYAIKVAQELNMKLIIAARYLKEVKVERDYFEKYIKQHLKDPRIKFIGEVNEEERNKLMSRALCILHPVTWPEPFGLTMIEAMACGCPVIAFDKGSIPEVVANGKSGFVISNTQQMIAAVKKISKINRMECRQYVLDTFSVERMTDRYLEVYEAAIKVQNAKKTKQAPWDASKGYTTIIPKPVMSPKPVIYTHELPLKKEK